MAAREQDFYSQVCRHNETIWNALNELRSLQAEWTALDYTTTLGPGEGTYDGLTKADLSAVLFTTVNAIDVVLAAGHATNMCKLLR